MAEDLPPQTEVSRNDQGVVRHLSHARSLYRPSGFVPASPASLAAVYLERFGDLFGVSIGSFLTQRMPDEYGGTGIEANRLALSDVKSSGEFAVVSYEQVHAGLPVFEAGVAVRVHRDLAVISAHSTLHLDIDTAQLMSWSEPDALQISGERLAGALGLGARSTLPVIEAVRVVIYRYLPEMRVDAATAETDQPVSSPRLPLPAVPADIVAGRHYVVRDVQFSLELSGWGVLHWRALVELRTEAALYVRAFVESCTGAVFRDDPITISGDPARDPCAPAAMLDPLADVVQLDGLSPPGVLGAPQPLSGVFVELVDSDAPNVAPPTAVLPACEFVFSSTTNDFAAVNAYVHMDSLYRMVEGMGFANYFPGTTFPIPMDHQGVDPADPDANNGVNAHHHGTGSGTIKFRFGLAHEGCPVGIACDRRVVIHEFGHSVLRNHIDSGTFVFAHGIGDTLAVILSDPRSQAPDRFDTFPFTDNSRRHDRDVATGWGWGGANDVGGYRSEQILSTTLFRAYRSIGGDAAELAERQFAARLVVYLIFAAVDLESPVDQPGGPEDFAVDLMEADRATTMFDGHPGGTVHKVLRWAFEKQNAYQGQPPDVDVYIDDGRAGEYPWLDDVTDAPDIWVRREPDGGTTHEDPLVGTPSYVYAQIRNRGHQPAWNVTVRGFTGPAGGGVWPDAFLPLSTADLPVPAPIAPGGSVVVGPFDWTPATTTGASIIMSASTEQDLSNLETVSAPVETRRLLPFDNNAAQRDVVVLPYPVQYSVKFLCGPSGSSGPCGSSPVAPGSYFTAINVHNPTDQAVRFRKKVAVALPGERPGHVSEFTFNRLGPDEALEIDCADIYNRVGLPGGCFLKGFLVLQSTVELDVVAVYSAAGADGHVETLDLERVPPRIAVPEKGEPRLADLVPLPAFPPPSTEGQLPQGFCFSTVGGRRADALRIVVRNQGEADAVASVTQVVFENNPPIHIPTPAIPAGGEVTVEVMIPPGCFVGQLGCGFEITVDATSIIQESDETNNQISGSCPPVQG